ncbi:MAG: hypothetical protein A2W90_22185 [Bacteroidetes bacterium GWF2_42_66]|nr:MAG: hypothetical protein A2W89_11305 [Bacteroidetes bacterium GWE2_42_39]OFY43622.1 MAG: hypothetical protein A2W90_22185 [Bacteroidetes bacterium GWF2_42_66]HBL75255.1 hypothetical protein [Prolixibacteraceae bacterium]HCU59715.1 hypothetical protein [Prolixibacteraceae bacterium]
MKTRRLLAVLLILMSSAGAFTQNTKTLTNDDLFLWQGNGVYGAVDYNWCNADGVTSVVNGAKVLFMKDHRYGVGFGFSSVNRNTLNNHGITSLHFGGPELEYTIAPHNLIFPSVHLFSGMAYFSNYVGNDLLSWFVEPGVKIYLNVASFMRFSVNANYRNFRHKPDFNTQVMNGPNFGFSVAYGRF